MRKALMAGNWKMNKTWAETVVLAQHISNQSTEKWTDVDVVICPAMPNIKAAYSVLEFDRAPIKVGAQNVHWEASGAYTGEASVSMLAELGAEYCIVGHSERREYFAETDEMVNKKAKALIAGGLIPIICVGESLGIRDDGSFIDYVCAQVRAALAGLEGSSVSKIVIAYEPIWAIGTGRTATPEQAQEVCAAIRATVGEMYGADVADAIRVLYGGSMKPENVAGLMENPDIDGGLIGGAALEAESFVYLVNACLD